MPKRGQNAGTQNALVNAISTGIGTGKTHTVDAQDVVQEDWAKWMQLDIMLKPSDLMKLTETSEEETGGDEKPQSDFKWEAEQGLEVNIEKVRLEFNAFRNLRPIKIFLSGPPGSGKSYFGGMLSEHYNVEHIKTADVVKGFVEHAGLDKDAPEEEDPYAELRGTFTELREKKVEEIQAAQKKKADVDPSSIPFTSLRWPSNAMSLAFKWKLRQNACKNRGFVLDNFPKSYEEAASLFQDSKEEPVMDDDNNPTDEVQKVVSVHKDILVNSVFVLRGDDAPLLKRVRELPEDRLKVSGITQDRMEARLKTYREINDNSEVETGPVQ